MSIELTRINNRLARIEKLLEETLVKVQPTPKVRLTEKEVVAEYGISKHILRRLRLGYKRTDGEEIAPALFDWRHYNGRNFDYGREELDRVLRKASAL